MSYQKNIRDLLVFYVKTNYEKYLKEHNLQFIPNNELSSIIETLYTERKSHIKIFVKDSLKELLKGEYPGDCLIDSIIREIFSDDQVCKERLYIEIEAYQTKQ